SQKDALTSYQSQSCLSPNFQQKPTTFPSQRCRPVSSISTTLYISTSDFDKLCRTPISFPMMKSWITILFLSILF
ncbi:hypothetical protein LOK49_LG09G00428, partial [Camellia lanceoleosa]